MPVTLDISTSSLRIVSFNSKMVEKWETAPLAPGLVRDGFIIQPQAVAEAVTALYKSLQLPKGSITATISGLSFVYRVVRLPRLKPALMTEAVMMAAKKDLPLPLEEVYLSWQTIGGDKEELELFLVGVPRNLIDALVQTMNSAGLRLRAVDLKSLALARVAQRADALLASFNSDCFDLVLVCGGKPVILHTVTPRGEGSTLEDNARKLVDEVTRTVDFYNVTHPATPVPATMPLLVTGALADDPSAMRFIQENAERPTEALSARIKSPANFPVAAYAGNIGLALKRSGTSISGKETSGFQDVDIDLMAGRQRIHTRRIPNGALVLPVAAIAAAVLLGVLFAVNFQIKADKSVFQSRVEAVSRELSLARARMDTANDTTAIINGLLTEVDKLRQQQKNVISRDVSTADILNIVISKLPPQANFTAMEITPRQITVNGQVNGKTDVISYAENMSKDARFSEVRISKIDEVPGTASAATRVNFAIVITRK